MIGYLKMKSHDPSFARFVAFAIVRLRLIYLLKYIFLLEYNS